MRASRELRAAALDLRLGFVRREESVILVVRFMDYSWGVVLKTTPVVGLSNAVEVNADEKFTTDEISSLKEPQVSSPKKLSSIGAEEDGERTV